MNGGQCRDQHLHKLNVDDAVDQEGNCQRGEECIRLVSQSKPSQDDGIQEQASQNTDASAQRDNASILNQIGLVRNSLHTLLASGLVSSAGSASDNEGSSGDC